MVLERALVQLRQVRAGRVARLQRRVQLKNPLGVRVVHGLQQRQTGVADLPLNRGEGKETISEGKQKK